MVRVYYFHLMLRIYTSVTLHPVGSIKLKGALGIGFREWSSHRACLVLLDSSREASVGESVGPFA